MGITGLNMFLKTHIPEILNKKDLSLFKHKRVGIDTSIYLYKFKYNKRNFIESFVKQIYRLKLNNITPIYIFDGKPPVEKQKIITIRKKKKETYLISIKELEQKKKKCKNLFEIMVINTKIEHIKRNLVKITPEDIDTLKQLLKRCGVTFIQSETESDILFGTLFKSNYIDLVLSEDNDILVHGCPNLLKNFNIYSNQIILYDKTYIITKLGLTNTQWVHFCILMGCDYFKKIPYPSKKIYKLIQTYTINDLIYKINLDKQNRTDFINAKRIFNSYPILKNSSILETTIDLVNLKTFLQTHTRLYERTINKIIEIIHK